MKRRQFIVLGLSMMLFTCFRVVSAAEIPFDQAQFAMAETTGKPVLLRFHAAWCPTCRAQAPVLEKLLERPENADVTAFLVDYDAQKDVVHAFGVTSQSTLVVYQGDKEVSRSLGVTDEAGLAAEIAKAR